MRQRGLLADSRGYCATTYPRACMHALYTAQYRVIGGSGAGSGGSFTLDAAALSEAPPATVSEAPLPATAAEAAAVVAAADAAVVAVAAADAAGALADFIAAALFAVVAVAPLAAGAAAGMLAPNGAAEKLLGGIGGRDGAPVDEVLVATG